MFKLADIGHKKTSFLLTRLQSSRSKEILLTQPLIVSEETIAMWMSTASRILNKIIETKHNASKTPKPQNTYLPDCMTMDFAVVKKPDEQAFSIDLIESSAFPNIYHISHFFEAFYNPLSKLDGLTLGERKRLLEKSIRQGKEHVLMIDKKPFSQPTALDFTIAEEVFEVNALDNIRHCPEKGFVSKLGRQISHIYNRVIPEDLTIEEKQKLFNLLSNTTCFGHPYWSYALSKEALMQISDPNVPTTLSASLENFTETDDWVLKPKSSYGSRGVNLSPNTSAIQNVDDDDYIIQRKVNYADCVISPMDSTLMKAEIRFMYVRDDSRYFLSSLAAKISRDSQMGLASKKQRQSGEGFAVIMSPEYIR